MTLTIKIKLVRLDCDNTKNTYKTCATSVAEWVHEIRTKKPDMAF